MLCCYHLAKFGWKDTILLERDQLTSGTTWHAAGLVSQLGPTAAITKIRKYTLDLYKKLEKEVDHSAGLRLNGALSIAQNKGRWQELQRQATTAQLYDVDVRILDKDQIKKNYPIIETDDVIGGILMPGDGAADPSGVTHMLAKAARLEGAKIFEQSSVSEILTKNNKIIKHIFFGHQHITSSGSYCGITFSSPRSTWSPLIPNFSNEYRLGTANTDTNYNVAIIRSDALIIHTEDFLKTEVNWFK